MVISQIITTPVRSFNLSSSALYYREEIGVSINDLDNLVKLERYCQNVIHESKPYGYSSLLNYGSLEDRKYDTSPDYIEGMTMGEYYHEVRDILKVKQRLGHKTLRNTMVYIDIEKAIYGELRQEFTVRVAEDPQEIEKLLQVGFEYVCEKDGRLFFRKRK